MPIAAGHHEQRLLVSEERDSRISRRWSSIQGRVEITRSACTESSLIRKHCTSSHLNVTETTTKVGAVNLQLDWRLTVTSPVGVRRPLRTSSQPTLRVGGQG